MRLWLRRFLFLVPFLAFANKMRSHRKISLILSVLQSVSAGWILVSHSGFCDLKRIRKLLQLSPDGYFILCTLAGGMKINTEFMFAFSTSYHKMRNYMNDLRCFISAVYVHYYQAGIFFISQCVSAMHALRTSSTMPFFSLNAQKVR